MSTITDPRLSLEQHGEQFDAGQAAEAIRHHLASPSGQTLVSSWCTEALEADVADALALLDDRELSTTLALIKADPLASIIGYLPLSRQARALTLMPRSAAVAMLEEMSSDERADLFNALPEGGEALLPALAQAEREDIRRLASYDEDSVGAIMSSQYATLRPGLTAAQAIDELRRLAPDSETIYNAYVVDDERRLIGVTTLRRLILASADTLVAEIMESQPVSARVDADRETAASTIARYDFIALPVLDQDGRMVGIVTADDALDVLEEEATEDFHKAGGSASLPTRMKDASVRLLYRKRVFWLVLLVFVNIFSGAGMAHFEDVLAANIALVFFLPLLIDSGGNAGSQSSTMMVRALATGDVHLRDWAGMLGRELAVATLLGLTMALAVSAVGAFRAGPEIALVVALTMFFIVIVGSVIGMSLPFLLSRFKGDPASASSPLITTISDISGILIYFGIASQLLPRLAAS